MLKVVATLHYNLISWKNYKLYLLNSESGIYPLVRVLRLYGYKWFSSATDSDMSLTLARLEGGAELGMFYLKTRDEAGQLNNIQVRAVNWTLGL